MTSNVRHRFVDKPKFQVDPPNSFTRVVAILCVVSALAGCTASTRLSSTSLAPSAALGSTDTSTAVGSTQLAEICRQVLDAGGRPLDPASYAQFRVDFNDSSAQKTEFHEIDRSPELLSAVPPVYPSWARRCGVEGRVVLRIQVNKEGRVVSTIVIGNPSGSLASAARTAVQQWRFQPHTAAGKPIAVAFFTPVNFVLSPPPGESRVQVGRSGISPDQTRKEQELTYLSAKIEAGLGTHIRYVTTLTSEQPLLEYARSFATRARNVDEASNTFSHTNRVVVTIDRDGRVVAVNSIDAKDDALRQRNEMILMQVASLGPLPETPGGEIHRIAFALPINRLPQDDDGQIPYQAGVSASPPQMFGSAANMQRNGLGREDRHTYGEKIAATVRRHVVFPDAAQLPGNPGAEFDVRLDTDGSVQSVDLTKSSGYSDWDAAARRALVNTKTFPLDVSGKAPPRIFITMRPKL